MGESARKIGAPSRCGRCGKPIVRGPVGFSVGVGMGIDACRCHVVSAVRPSLPRRVFAKHERDPRPLWKIALDERESRRSA